MITTAEARRIGDIAQIAKKYEQELDAQIELAFQVGIQSASVPFPAMTGAIATYMAKQYIAAGWVVTVHQLQPSGFAIEVSLPPEPKRGGPEDR